MRHHHPRQTTGPCPPGPGALLVCDVVVCDVAVLWRGPAAALQPRGTDASPASDEVAGLVVVAEAVVGLDAFGFVVLGCLP